MATSVEEFLDNDKRITEEELKLILSKNSIVNGATTIKSYSVQNANNKMLGFLAEYWKIKVHLTNRKVLYFFVKAISRTNIAKAEMVKEMNLFNKEARFYCDIKKQMELPDIQPWSPQLITLLDDAMVFEDLNALNYKLKDKFERFDMVHTLEALKTLARFHASSIIFEERKRVSGNPFYTINDDYSSILDKAGYQISCDWYHQCMLGALEAMKSFSKFDTNAMKCIERDWCNIWSTALNLSNFDPNRRNVICHRDLWNNNIMFRYIIGDGHQLIPDNCMLVDFQAVRYQPPASDVMVLLCSNLDPQFRKENFDKFINFYYEELQKILSDHHIEIDDVMTKEDFMNSAEEQTKWGLVVCACLIPQFWLDDDLTTRIFSDNEQFTEILCKNKGRFIKKMMENNYDYRKNVMEIFEEIADRYCFNGE